MESASAHEVAAAAARGEVVIDVRNADEYARGHIPRSIFMPLPTVPLRVSDLDRHAPVYVICESGARAFQACQFLQQHGYRAINVDGGMTSYRGTGLPIEAGVRTTDRQSG
jgi:rhodanese-related sulfurtransferase